MADLLTQYSEWIEKYHEHDSLLENVVEEELNEEERKLAWEDFENDKNRDILPIPGAGNVLNPGTAISKDAFITNLRLKYPNASEMELNAMLQTYIYQLNRITFVNRAQLLQSQQGASTSQMVVTPNFQTNTTNVVMTPQQISNLQRNYLYQKFGQQLQSNPVPRMGNGEIKKQSQNTIRNQNKGNLMRQQQEAELARVKNQMTNQKSMLGQASSQLNNIYRTNQQPQPISNRQSISNGQPAAKKMQWPVHTSITQKHNVVGNRQANSREWISKATSQNQMLKQPEVKNKQQELMNRIQREQQRTHRQKDQRSLTITPLHKRQLEEMKKRYNASRKNMESIVVEIDDDPTEPSN